MAGLRAEKDGGPGGVAVLRAEEDGGRGGVAVLRADDPAGRRPLATMGRALDVNVRRSRIAGARSEAVGEDAGGRASGDGRAAEGFARRRESSRRVPGIAGLPPTYFFPRDAEVDGTAGSTTSLRLRFAPPRPPPSGA
ncbi:MAG: hypothetical protein ABI585_08305 [Betaproteobacteria bacterium]